MSLIDCLKKNKFNQKDIDRLSARSALLPTGPGGRDAAERIIGREMLDEAIKERDVILELVSEASGIPVAELMPPEPEKEAAPPTEAPVATEAPAPVPAAADQRLIPVSKRPLTPAAEAPTLTEPSIVKEPAMPTASNEIVSVKDIYGRTVRVRQRDLSGDAERLPTVRANGDIIQGEEIPRSILRATIEEKFRDIVRNKETAGLKATFGAPFTPEYVKSVYDKIASEKGQEEADRLLDSTVGIAKDEARDAVTQALGSKFYDAFSAWPKADAQLVAAVKSGSVAATDDQLRVLGISKDQIGEVGSDGVKQFLGQFNAGVFKLPGGISYNMAGTAAEKAAAKEAANAADRARSADYVEAAKRFLQGDLTAKFPGKKDDNLNTEFVENVVPKSIPKKIKQVKNAADALKAVGSIAPDAGKDVRFYLSGVHIEDGGKRLVATDGHRLVLVDDAPTGALPEKERSTDTVLGKDGKWIEGKFPDYKRVLPEKHETAPVEVSAEAWGDYARGVARAGRYVSDKINLPVRFTLDGHDGYVAAKYIAEMTDVFRAFGYDKFTLSFGGIVGKDRSIYAESTDRRVRQVIMGMREDSKLLSPVVDGKVPTVGAEPVRAKAPSVKTDSRIEALRKAGVEETVVSKAESELRAGDASLANDLMQIHEVKTEDERLIPVSKREVAAPAAPIPTQPAVTAQPDGRIAVTGLPAETVKTVRDLLGIKGAIIGANGNAIFPKGTNVKALRESLGVTEAAKPAAAPSTPAAERPLSVGLKAKGGALNAEPVTVRDGVVHIGEDPATNLDGENITVPAGATNADIRKALEDGGALTTAQRVYGGEPAVKSKAIAATNPHTAASLRTALIAAHPEMKPLLDNGTVQVVTAEQAGRVLGEPVTTRDKAFFNPEDGTTYFIAEHIDRATPLRGLIKHEVAVHAYQLGRTSAEFKDILRQVEAMKGAEVEAARATVPADTLAEHRAEEALAYLVQNNPTLGIVKRFVAWFRNAIRAMGWKGPLSVNDLVYMADRAMTGGTVVARGGQAMRSVIRADGYNIIKDPERQQAANLIARSESGDLRGIRDPADGSLYVWDAYKATHQDAAEVLGIDRNKAERLIFSSKELADLPPGVFSDEPGYRVTRTALPEPTVGEAKLTHAEFQKAFFSRGEPTHYGALTAEQLRAVTNVVGKPQTMVERAKEFHKNWRKSLEQGVFDQYAPIKEVSQDAYIKARMTKGGDSTLEAIFMYGKPVLDENGAVKVQFDKANKGLNGFANVLSKLDGEHDRFLLWVAAQRAEALKAIGLENLWSHSDIAALKTLDTGTMQNGLSRDAAYATALKEMMAYNNAVLDIAYQRGLISDATRMMYRETPYVPFYRLADENVVNGFTAQAGMVNQHAWKKLSGGTGKLNEDLLANMLQNWSHLITASARNDAAKATLEEAVRLGIAEEVPSGSPVKGAVVFRENSNTVMKDGVRVVAPDQPVRNHERSFIVNDPHLLEAISALGNVVRVPKVLRLFKHYLTLGVTINPAFKIRNLMRDSIQAMALSDVSLNPAKNIAAGVKLTAKESETRAQMLASGAIIRFGSMLDGQNADMGRELVEKMGVPRDHILDDASKIEKFWKHTVRPAFDAYQELGDRGEQINRAALYDRLIKKGMSHGEAAFWARDLMDFSMSGSWSAIRFLTQTVPFMNARLQGLYKLGRSAQADKKRFATVVGGVALASLALLAAYHDDDDWKKREDWDRDNYWWFKVGGKAFYIPKPFEIGAIGTMAERLAEYMTDDEMTGKRFGTQLFNLVNHQLSMNPTPQAIKPLIDLWANKDSFTGKAIETMGMERLKPEDRYKQSTSGVARVLSQLGMPNPTQLAMGEYQQMSPVQIDHLIRAYFSWVGTSATTVLDYGIFRPIMDKTERPAMQLQDVFLAGNFVKDLPSGSSRYVTQMYEQAKEIEQAYNSYRAALKTGDKERAASLMESEGEKIRQYHKIETIKRAESKLSERARIVERSAMSPEAKRDALTMIANQRDLLARRVSP